MRKKRKRVLLVNFEMTYTGSPRALLNLTKALKELGYNPDVWSLNSGPFEKEFADIGIKVRIIHFPEEISPELENDIKDYRYVIANTVFCAAFASYANAFAKTILYIMEAGNLAQLINDCCLDANDITSASRILCVSEYAKRCITDAYPTKRIRVLPNYVEQWDKRPLNRKSDNIIRFVVSGTIEFRKGQEVAEKAFLMLPIELQEKAELHFVGAAPDWSIDYQEELHEKQTDRIIFHDEIHDKNKLLEFYDSMNVIIVASRDEACSLVALEAAMLGKALLVTENTGAKYVVARDSCILPTGDVDRLTEKMKEYIEHPCRDEYEGKLNYKQYLSNSTHAVFIRKLKRYMLLLKFL